MRAAPGVWALGDITGKGAFTHMSMYQAGIVIDDILGREHCAAEYHAVPRVTFTDPEIGAVGLTEREAREAGLTVRTSLTQVPQSARGWIHKAGNDGFIKLVEDCDRGVLAGATSAGPWGGEVLGALVVAVHAAVPGPAPARNDLRLPHVPPRHRRCPGRPRARARPGPGPLRRGTGTPGPVALWAAALRRRAGLGPGHCLA